MTNVIPRLVSRFWKSLWLLVGVYLCGALAQTSGPLTNTDVLAMLDSKLGSSVILVKLETSLCEFDTSPTALAAIKAAGATDAVLIAMVKGCPSGTPAVGLPAERSRIDAVE